MSKSNWQHVKGGFLFYGEVYATKNACIKAYNMLGGYQELKRHMKREKEGLPYLPIQRGKGRSAAQSARWQKLAKRCIELGIWKGEIGR